MKERLQKSYEARWGEPLPFVDVLDAMLPAIRRVVERSLKHCDGLCLDSKEDREALLAYMFEGVEP